MDTIVSPDHRTAAQRFRAIYSTYLDAEDLINIGAFASGSNPRIDRAISLIERVKEFLIQPLGTRSDFPETVSRLAEVTESWEFLMPRERQPVAAQGSGNRGKGK